MATNTNLGGVFTTDIDNKVTNSVFLSTENVVGLIIDTSIVGGIEKALKGNEVAAATFANGNIVELNNSKDIAEVGIDETIMGGLVKYHLDCFFTLAGNGQRLFLSFMNSDDDPDFEAVEKMQLASSGIIYQIGVWTAKPFATKNADGTISVEPGNILSKLQGVAETLGGRVGVTNYEGNAPLNLLVQAPALNEATVDITKLPDISDLDYPKVSVLIGQGTTDAIHKTMYDLNHLGDTPTYVSVGCLGMALACLAIAPANESIAHVENFNLAAAVQDAELGFGSLVDAEGDDAEGYAATSSFTNIKTLGYTKRNEYLHKKGYIFLTNFDGLENSIFFSSDQTLSLGSYRSLNRCRVMHKSRRVVRRALLPKVNSSIEVDSATGQLGASTIATFQNLVINALNANMVEPGTTKPQISACECTIDLAQDVLNTDEIKIDYAMVPLGIVGVINVTEGFTTAIS